MRAFALAIAMMLFQLPAYAVDNVDRPGGDYDNFSAKSELVCFNSCEGDSRCQAWTWVKTGWCWLKNTVPKQVRNNCCMSGVHTTIYRTLREEVGTDRPGSDLIGQNFAVGSWGQCRDACAQNPNCNAWTYVRPAAAGQSGWCWLKNTVPHPVSNARTTSGVKWKGASRRFD